METEENKTPDRSLELGSFDSFKVAAFAEYSETSKSLDKALPEDPEGLSALLSQAEALGSRISYLLAKAEKHLDKAEAVHLIPKSKDYTDLDRETHLKAAVAQEGLIRDLLQSCVDSIKTKISLGQSILAVIRAEIERGLYQ